MCIEEQIIFEDEGMIIVYKKAGVPVQTKSITVMDLESQVKNYLAKKTKSNPYLGIIHRLDQPVEGLVLFAKTEKVAAILSKEINDDKIEKYYTAAVCGKPIDSSGELIDYLIKDTKNNLSKVVLEGTKGAKKSRLEYEVLDWIEDISLLNIRLFTGRHHQIRLQLSNMGCPIIGDRKYNTTKSADSIRFPALAAYRLVLNNPLTGEQMDIKIMPQEDFYKNFNLHRYFD